MLLENSWLRTRSPAVKFHWHPSKSKMTDATAGFVITDGIMEHLYANKIVDDTCQIVDENKSL